MSLRTAATLGLFAVAVLVASTPASAARQHRVYVVTRDEGSDDSLERRSLAEQFDRQLRAELRRRGADVHDRAVSAGTIVLRPTLEIVPQGLSLRLIGLRAADRRLLGAISLKAAGSNRQALLRAMVTRAGDEADQLD